MGASFMNTKESRTGGLYSLDLTGIVAQASIPRLSSLVAAFERSQDKLVGFYAYKALRKYLLENVNTLIIVQADLNSPKNAIHEHARDQNKLR